MSYDQYVLPVEHCASAAAAEAYLDTQWGVSASPAAAALAQRIEARLADRLALSPLVGEGEIVAVLVVFRAVEAAREVVHAEARSAGRGVYDPQVGIALDPGDALPGVVTTDDGDFPTLTLGGVAQLVDALGVGRFVIVGFDDPDTYAQTYRNSDADYTVEHRAGSAERHFGTTVATAQEVTRILHAWLRGDRATIDAVAWERVEF